MGRIRFFVTVCDFSAVATCYAELNGRLRPEADLASRSNRDTTTEVDMVFLALARQGLREILDALKAAKRC